MVVGFAVGKALVPDMALDQLDMFLRPGMYLGQDTVLAQEPGMILAPQQLLVYYPAGSVGRMMRPI